MTVFPYGQVVSESGWVTDTQLKWLTGFQYLITALLALLLIATGCNIWWFLVKQGRYRVYPLLLYYILAVLFLLSRLYFTIWFFKINMLVPPLAAMTPPTLKCMLVLVQCWIMIELGLRIRANIKAQDEAVAASFGRQSTGRIIKCGHVLLTVFIVFYLAVNLSYIGY